MLTLSAGSSSTQAPSCPDVLAGADDGQVLVGHPSDALAQLKNAQAFSLDGLVVHLRGAA